MDEVARIARERRPKLLLAGWSAYPRQLDFARFREIADEVGALLMVDMAHFAGLVAAGLHPNPVEFGADVVTTTTHKTLGGPRAGMILCKEELRQEDRLGGLPRPAGRPARARDRGQGRGAAGSPPASCSPSASGARVDGRAGARRGAARRPAHGVNVLTGGTDVHLVLVDLRDTEPAERQAGRGPPARDRDHRQPQRGAVRPAPADGGLGPAHRHARAGHARAAAGGLHRGRAHPRDRADAGVRGPRAASSPSACRRSSSAIRCTSRSGRRCAALARLAGARAVGPRADLAAPATSAPAMLCASRWRTRPSSTRFTRFLVAAAVTALLTPAHDAPRERASARSTSRASAGSPIARRRCSAAWRSSPACSSRRSIWLPAGYGKEPQLWHGVLLGAGGDHARRARSTTASTCTRC